MTSLARYDGMVHIPGGCFTMGSDDFYADERPSRRASVGSFWMDMGPVTNAQFTRFVQATGYVTLAERPPNPADYPGIANQLLQPGSIVFTPPSAPVALSGEPTWWQYVIGAGWRHPTGPDSGIDTLDDHPVVHVSIEDAFAYAAWMGKSLPTEAEWEYAAKGGLVRKPFAWGDELFPEGRRMAKTWEGIFPWYNAAAPGLERTSPVGLYPANGYGIFDMVGNVWELTADIYHTLPGTAGFPCCGDARKVTPTAVEYVAKGGSHLCAPEYCQRYRPSARWPQPSDTTTSHTGFRCVDRG